MSGLLDGKVALVTGGVQGLGAAFALGLADAGAAVVIGDLIDGSAVSSAIAAAGGRALAVRLDVTDPASIAAAVAQATDAFGGLDILVNNAGIASTLTATPFIDIDEDQWDHVMCVNLRGAFSCMKAAARAMKGRGGGAIVNIASGTALKGTPGYLHYVASKGALIAVTRAAARELGGDDIRVNAIAPGLIMTDNVRALDGHAGKPLESAIAERAIKREGLARDVVGTLVYLASPQSGFVTGQTIVVDGGAVMT